MKTQKSPQAIYILFNKITGWFISNEVLHKIFKFHNVPI